MTSTPTLLTPRLILRPFLPADRDDLAARIYADPLVMRYMPRRSQPALERSESAILAFTEHWKRYGYGAWAVCERLGGRLMGQCGLNCIPESDEVEIFYALGQDFWGRGFATEAARAGLRFGFETAGLPRIVAVAAPENRASRRVLEKLGMSYIKNARYFGMDTAYYELQAPSSAPH